MPHGLAKGHRIDRDEFNAMLQRFYKLRGWTEDGVVPEERIAELIAPWKAAKGAAK